MNLRRFRTLIPSSLLFVLLLSLSSSDRSQYGQGFLANPSQAQRVDGGGPVPPLPPKSFLNTLTVDGGGPVPPLPPVSFLKTLTADGGGPVPPLPPVFSSANSLAV
jgi:hypothetical protein